MLRSPVSARRRAASALAGVLGTLSALVPAAGGAEYAECLTPALPRSVSFADASVQPAGYVQAAPVLQSHAFSGPPLGGPSFHGPSFGGPGCGPPPGCGMLNRPHDGSRRITGLPAYRPFGLPMLSEVGSAIGHGVGAVGATVGAMADDLLLGPVGAPLCGGGPGYCPPPSCAVPQLRFQPLHAGPSCVAPLCPPPMCAAPEPLCAAPPPMCAAPCPPPTCVAPPVCAAPPTCEVELVPRTTTKYARRECVTWKEVECIAYRNCKEEYVEPVCKTECRVVDRGCWKKIWVPNMVTEEYTTTDYVRRCRVRRVPYTYTKQVAERCEKIVPYCATTYVPRPVSACLPEPDCGAPDFMPSYSGYGSAEVPPSAPVGSYYGAEAYDAGSYGGAMYGSPESYGTGVPGVEEYMPPTAAPAPVPLRPIPNDDFKEGGAAPESGEADRTSMLPTVPARTAARGWTEQARQF